MAKMQRDKGRAFEQWVVRQFKAAGFHAERTAPMQANFAGYCRGDVEVRAPGSRTRTDNLIGCPDDLKDKLSRCREMDRVLKIECKHHATIPEYLYKPDPFGGNRKPSKALLGWLAGNDAVVFRRGSKHDRSWPVRVFLHRDTGYCVLDLSEYIRELKGEIDDARAA